MKHFGTKFTSLFFALVLIVFSVTMVSADDSNGENKNDVSMLTINDKGKVAVGKTVSYTLYLDEAKEPIEGFELRLFFDSENLKYKKGTLKFEKFNVVFYNENIEGKIPMNYTSITNMPSFDKKTQFLTADFEVIKEGNATISQFFTELYGENMDYLKSYKFTYDLTVDGKKIVEDGVPVVNNDPDTLEHNQGDFKNYADGMGDDNSPKTKDHVLVGSGVKTNVIEVQKNSSQDQKNGSSGGLIIKIIIAVLFVLLVSAAIVIVVLTTRRKKKPEE